MKVELRYKKKQKSEKIQNRFFLCNEILPLAQRNRDEICDENDDEDDDDGDDDEDDDDDGNDDDDVDDDGRAIDPKCLQPIQN